MSLSLFALLLGSPSVRAQYPGGGSGGYPGGSGSGGSGYPGGGSGYPGSQPDGWVVTYQATGKATHNGMEHDWVAPPAGSASAYYGTGSPESGDYSNKGTITAVYTWTSAQGTPPPLDLYAILDARANAYFGTYNSGPIGTGTADNGFGDGANGNSRGLHLQHQTNSSGSSVIAIPVPMMATVTGTTYGSTEVFLSASVDTSHTPRSVTISSNVDSTNSKQPDPNSPSDANGDSNYIGIPHVRESNGTMRGDVGLSITGPNDFTNIAYHANLTGNWQTPGSYNWFSSLKQVSDNGSLYPPDFTNVYAKPWWVDSDTPGVPPYVHLAEADPSKPDHLHITCIDGGDGATASADYYMTLHPAMEQNYPDHVTHGIENLRKAPNATYVRSTQDDSTVTVYAENGDEWGVTATTDGPVGDFIAGILAVNLSVSYSISYNSGVQTSIQHVNVGFATYLEEFDAYKYHTGKVDLWNMSGYSGTAPYHLKEPDSPAGGYQAHSPPIYLGAG